jgi:hypothetical protein
MSKTAARTQQDRESGLVWIERPGAEDGRRPGNQTEIDTPRHITSHIGGS